MPEPVAPTSTPEGLARMLAGAVVLSGRDGAAPFDELPPAEQERYLTQARQLLARADEAQQDGAQPQEADGPRTVCVCGHTRAEHATVSGRLLCDECDPDSTENLTCEEFEAL